MVTVGGGGGGGVYHISIYLPHHSPTARPDQPASSQEVMYKWMTIGKRWQNYSKFSRYIHTDRHTHAHLG